MLFSAVAKFHSAQIGSHREIVGDDIFSQQYSTWENIVDRPTGGLSVIVKENSIVVHCI